MFKTLAFAAETFLFSYIGLSAVTVSLLFPGESLSGAYGFECRVWGLGLRVWGIGLRVVSVAFWV